MDLPEDLSKAISLLESHLWNVGNESELQTAISKLWERHNIPHYREFRVNSKSRFDFYIPSSKACVELKVVSNFKKVIMQLQRYALLECVDFMVIVTTKNKMSNLYPDQIAGKPLRKVVLRVAF